ncbi:MULTISPECIES: 5-deoxy-glucuronate isomerase [Caballeronia]|uniref:IolB protein n=1 Tax=Caballeronia cordobensis TaxID=1353886 RepID=A0A158IJD3_CABCO|nr:MULTISPECIES: 5-deoxy-glucuronate isomerase [Caballeronia]BAO86938.1 Myo-inositol catabolism IolB domain protein [Burkholderia sp. RPE67]BBP96823.1 5-deoxy-glucuronate isomerase [Burkholderia sp. SFA1]MCE4541269.1 5-deoxy-glucuronate isomerase [Caballeronia sp. PC1]MCE4569688.1 5-deoxy-glucuronate isomerase [Caballeronia sp. CLC5]SAL56668.1 iolB protein [Caballeronia cordobensis]
MSLLVKASREEQTIARVTPDSAGWKHVGFAAYRLNAGDVVHVYDADRESCIVVLTGTVSVEAGDEHWPSIGTRDSVFEDAAPYAVYVPPKLAAIVHAERDAEIAVASAPAKGDFPPRLIEPAQMKRSTRGRNANTRYVCDILPQTEAAESLLVVEVRTPGGHASSYPPHKHDRDNVPLESALEETYYHRLNPPQGFAFQRVYTDERDLDETMTVEDHDVVMVPRGYHPVVVPYGYDNYYLNVMAGDKRTWHFKNDPKHEWIVERDSKASSS